MFMAGACGDHGPNNVISVDIKESHSEFRVNQELTKGHMDLSVLLLDSSSRKNLGLETKILSLSILAKRNFT